MTTEKETPSACGDMSDGEQQEQHGNTKARKGAKSSRWFAVAVADLDKIIHNRTGGKPAIMLALWISLLRESHFKRSLTFTLGDELTAQKSGLSRRTVFRYVGDLEAAGLLVPHVMERDNATNRYPPRKWTIKPSQKPFMASPRCVPESQPRCVPESQPHCDRHDTPPGHKFLQSSSGGFPSKAARDEETVSKSRGRRSPSPQRGRAEAASLSETTHPVKHHKTELDAIRAFQREEYR